MVINEFTPLAFHLNLNLPEDRLGRGESLNAFLVWFGFVLVFPFVGLSSAFHTPTYTLSVTSVISVVETSDQA